MIIIEQNVNQDKYIEKLNDENCFIKLKNQNANIIVLNEVVRPNFIIDRINALTNMKYYFAYNDKDIYCYDTNHKRILCNKILILFEKEKYDLIYKNENLYEPEKHIDFLHLTIKDKNSIEYNIIGIRIHFDYSIDNPSKVFEQLKRIIKYASSFNNVIMAGDFNNSTIMLDRNYNDKYNFYKEYNYHKIFDLINLSVQFKIYTDGIIVEKDDNGKDVIVKKDEETKYTYKGKYKSIIDHFIVSNDFINCKIENIEDCEIDFLKNGYGIPDHKIVRFECEKNSSILPVI